MHDLFVQLLTARYTSIKSQYPYDLGRRKWHLRVLQEFWANPSQAQAASQSIGPKLYQFMQDPDFLDELVEGPEAGVLIRTDFTDEHAWDTFYEKLQESERELAESMKPDESDSRSSEPPAATGGDPSASGNDSDSESSTEGTPFPIIKVIDPTLPDSRALFNGISNLSALRLLNDVDIQPSLRPAKSTEWISPPNRLIDHDGWQEVYSGPNIWIYDALSNTDQCVRLVGQNGGGIYGTATGDSWRARGTHICELQFNMTYLGMKIDFGGLDRWDYGERKRNMDEAASLL